MVGVDGCSFLLSDLFRRKKFKPLFLLAVLTGVSGAVDSLLVSFSLSFSLDFSLLDDLEDRNIGKKLWLDEFLDSFWGGGGVTAAAAAVGLTAGAAVGEEGEVS